MSQQMVYVSRHSHASRSVDRSSRSPFAPHSLSPFPTRIKVEADPYAMESLMLTVEEENVKDEDEEWFDAPTDVSYDGMKQEPRHEPKQELQRELKYESIEVKYNEVYPEVTPEEVNALGKIDYSQAYPNVTPQWVNALEEELRTILITIERNWVNQAVVDGIPSDPAYYQYIENKKNHYVMIIHAFREARAYWIFGIAFASLFATFRDMRNNAQSLQHLTGPKLSFACFDHRSKIQAMLLKMENSCFPQLPDDELLLHPIKDFFCTLLRTAILILNDLIYVDLYGLQGETFSWEAFLEFFQALVMKINVMKQILLCNPNANVEEEMAIKYHTRPSSIAIPEPVREYFDNKAFLQLPRLPNLTYNANKDYEINATPRHTASGPVLPNSDGDGFDGVLFATGIVSKVVAIMSNHSANIIQTAT